MARNNILTCGAILFTGATYTDIEDWATLVNLKIPHKTQCYAIQSKYLIPVIEHTYRSQQDKIIERVKQLSASGNTFCFAGDARCDSPGKHSYYFYVGWVLNIMNYTNIYFVSISLSGYSAKYSTYSFQDDATKEIMHFELVQVNQHTSYKMNCQDTT